MDRTIKHITEQLINLLPDEHQYYRPDELAAWGFPAFIVQRIRVELERNLAESMLLPQTDWANLQSPTVRTIWDQFVQAIRDEARLPASYAHTVLETAVADIMELLVQPQKNLPEIIFGTDKELTYDQVLRRMDVVAVYRHFAVLIPRYMQKKEIKVLSKERCAQIIANADARLTAHYSPLNWAQMLEPLFSLMDESIDTNLLRLFFEDKNMSRLARQFDQLDTTVTRAQLIEILSSPSSLNFEGYEEKQSEPSKPEDVKSTESGKPAKAAGQESGSPGVQVKDPEVRSEGEKDYSGKDHSLPEEKDKIIEGKDEKEEPEDEEFTINKVLFGKDLSRSQEADGPVLNNVFQKPGGRDTRRTKAGEEQQTEEPSPPIKAFSEPKADKEPASDTETAIRNAVPKKTGDEKPGIPAGKNETGTPMWKRFMSPEEIARLEEEEADPDDGYLNESAADLSVGPEASGPEAKSLESMLENDRAFFVRTIFKGSDRAYDKTLEEIVSKDNWQSASRYIGKEVFKKNRVDIYSEAAVYFTDHLQTYFSVTKNRNQ